jgi:hypothetical protein
MRVALQNNSSDGSKGSGADLEVIGRRTVDERCGVAGSSSSSAGSAGDTLKS